MNKLTLNRELGYDPRDEKGFPTNNFKTIDVDHWYARVCTPSYAGLVALGRALADIMDDSDELSIGQNFATKELAESWIIKNQTKYREGALYAVTPDNLYYSIESPVIKKAQTIG